MSSKQKPARKRNRPGEAENATPLFEEGMIRYPRAARSYRLAIYAMIPLAGLLLGPAAFLLGWRSLREGRRTEQPFLGAHLCKAAIFLGTLATLTQGAGLALVLTSLVPA
jgi:hypothetical protein